MVDGSGCGCVRSLSVRLAVESSSSVEFAAPLVTIPRHCSPGYGSQHTSRTTSPPTFTISYAVFNRTALARLSILQFHLSSPAHVSDPIIARFNTTFSRSPPSPIIPQRYTPIIPTLQLPRTVCRTFRRYAAEPQRPLSTTGCLPTRSLIALSGSTDSAGVLQRQLSRSLYLICL